MTQRPELAEMLVNVYRSLSKHPSLIMGQILRADTDNMIRIQSKWQQRNLERKEMMKFQKFHLVNIVNSDKFTFRPTDISLELISRFSNSEKFLCVVRETKDGPKKKQYLEIWKNDSLFKNFDIEEIDVHGSIYSDGEFGSLEFSPDETRVLYIAEKKISKGQPFYSQKPHKPDETKVMGEEYMYRDDWGEQLVEKHQPVVGICDLRDDTLVALDGIPAEFSPGQVIWSNDGKGIYGVVLNNKPRKLGLIYCTNRKGFIFHLSLGGKFSILSAADKSVRSPRLSPDGKYLYWLQRPADGPHDGCQEIVKYEISTDKREIIVPIVKRPSDFCGIYTHGLPRRCFSNDGRKLFFSTINKTRCVSYYVDTETGTNVLDVYNDLVLISSSSLKQAPSLKFCRLKQSLDWLSVTESVEVVNDCMLRHLEYEAKQTSEQPKEDFTYFNAIYFAPSPKLKERMPLLVCPHGGPHGCVPDVFSIEAAFFVTIGFAVLYVNYRGSTGAGQDSIDFLLGKIGDADVRDTRQAAADILGSHDYLDVNKVGLYGGSHGGFLVTHLSAKYPWEFKVVVARNPVIDVLSMYSITDIPDWNLVESGFTFDESSPLTPEQATKMLALSPISHAEKIKSPTFLMLGRKDLRVPFSQGLYLYNILKARGVKVRMNIYDDNHPLTLVPVHLDTTINAALWFFENMESD